MEDEDETQKWLQRIEVSLRRVFSQLEEIGEKVVLRKFKLENEDPVEETIAAYSAFASNPDMVTSQRILLINQGFTFYK